MSRILVTFASLLDSNNLVSFRVIDRQLERLGFLGVRVDFTPVQGVKSSNRFANNICPPSSLEQVHESVNNQIFIHVTVTGRNFK